MDSLEKVQEQRYDNFEKTSNEMTVGDWLITMLILIIPIVNIVMLFIWGFGNPDPRRNYARASLIWMAICIVLMLIFYGVVFAFIFSSFNSY
ncbi:hypothetical protein SAMN05421670_2000 [Psychrobacillus psychrotolerans]|uniref:Uncharacterized protein n=1 Tax=Psychrobacillus psychrotolerans TaxID=126156 RepID=A0A1I5YA91_9BACI|nr:hypothetical protein [Psychrobacillus psychrotolerans]SFQ41030.1 hypothetical protein SAMN05421670_2000 [Psychrobacillus psychrotolerans]